MAVVLSPSPISSSSAALLLLLVLIVEMVWMICCVLLGVALSTESASLIRSSWSEPSLLFVDGVSSSRSTSGTSLFDGREGKVNRMKSGHWNLRFDVEFEGALPRALMDQ